MPEDLLAGSLQVYKSLFVLLPDSISREFRYAFHLFFNLRTASGFFSQRNLPGMQKFVLVLPNLLNDFLPG